jgi:acyl-CoA thioesterase-1
MLAKTFVISLCSFLFNQNRRVDNKITRQKNYGFVLALWLSLFGITAQAQSNIEPTKKADSTVILVVGDSISSGYGLEDVNRGWVWLLQQRINQSNQIKPSYRVVNASIAGDTAIQGLKRLPRLLERHKPSLVVIELGGNDGLRGLAISQIQKQLTDMIVLSKKANARVILLGMKMPSNYSANYTQAFEKMYANLAKQQRIALVPWLFRYIGADPIWFQKDGIHPNEAAQVKLLDAVWPVLQPLL